MAKRKNEQHAQPSGRNIAIIGIGCLFPKAGDKTAYWANVRDGVDAIDDIPDTHWRPEDYFDGDPKSPDMTYARRGGFLDLVEFEPLRYGLAPNDIEATDTTQLLGLIAAERALADAGYPALPNEAPSGKSFDRERVSVIMGVTGTLELVIPLGARLGHPHWRRALDEAGVDKATADDVVERIAASYVPWQENSFPGLLGNVAAGRIANRLDLGGTNCVVDAACASSLSAIHMAGLELESGRADLAVTGGLDTFNDIFMYMCFSKTPALSPTGNARPFAKDADGTILGEGLGVVVLKRLEDAERDGDKVYAVIRGLGSSSDGKGNAIYAPDAGGQAKALRRAYAEAGFSPDTIELVEAHGTGTKVGDAVEVSALTDVYRTAADENGATDKTRWCALGSVKSQIGHTKAAAGAAGLIKAALSLYNKVLPPTAKVDAPAEATQDDRSPFYVNTVKRPWLATEGANAHPRRAAISSFGFGGSNFHVVLEEHGATKDDVDWSPDVQLAAFGGDDAQRVRSALEAWETTVFRAGDAPRWSDVRDEAARSRDAFDVASPHRLVLVLEEAKDLRRQLDQAKRLLDGAANATTGHWSTPDGCSYGIGDAPGKLGVVFPGQGSQYVGMLRDLSCQFPEMIDVLAEADVAFKRGEDDRPDAVERLSDAIYPTPKFDDEQKRADDLALRDTRIAQPAIGAVSAGAFRVLERFGLAPAAVAGHSFGELTALCASGRISTEALHTLSNLRGRLMGSGDGDRGSMLAVRASTRDIEAVIKEESIDLVIANRNAPTQSVLSGRTEEVDRAAAAFKSRNVPNDRLPVSAAFHSELVAAASAPFATALEAVEFAGSDIPTFANTTAAPYPEQATEAKRILAGQLSSPVAFVDEIENMYAAGIRTFVEVGPGPKITGLVQAILGERAFDAIALDQSRGRRPGMVDLASLLAKLAALGHAVDLRAWDATHEPAERSDRKRLTVPLNGANYMKPREPKPRRAPQTPVTPAAAAPATNPSQPHTTAPSAAPTGAVADAMRQNHDALLSLQRLQAETAALHRQFLENQMRSHHAIHALLGNEPLPAPQSAPLSAPLATPAAPLATPARPAAPVVANYGATPAAPPPAANPTPTVAPPAFDEGPAVAPTPPAAPAPSTAPGLDRGTVEKALLETVAEKTGYPAEMLELSMGLDADLGIDSIKRVEILSALEAALPGAPAIGPDQLGTLHTLEDVVGALTAGAATATPAASVAPSGTAAAPSIAPPAAQPSGDRDAIASALLSIVADKTGYPSEMLELSMGLDADLGIDSIKRVEILSAVEAALPDAPSIGPDQLGTLHTLEDVVTALAGAGGLAAAASAAPATTAAPSAAPEPSGASDDREMIAAQLLTVVAEKTGYPTEMLDLSMGLDADLGIDSIKRVEILSALESALPETNAVGSDQLGTLETLRDVVDALAGNGAAATATQPAPATTTQAEPDTTTPAPTANVETVPATTPNDALQVSRPTAVAASLGDRAIPDGATIAVAHEDSSLGKAVERALETAGFQPRRVSADDAASSSDGVAGLLIVASTTAVRSAFLKRSFKIAQALAPTLRQAGEGTGAVFATVTQLGGAFALRDVKHPNAAISGGLAGLAKTAAREWPSVACHAIDAGGDGSNDERARAIVDAATRRGPVELDVSDDAPRTIELAAIDVASGERSDAPIDAGDVVVVTGGARGVTADCAIELATRWRPTLLLLGRSQLESEEDPALEGLEGAALKRTLIERAKKAGDDTSPKAVQRMHDAVVAARAARDTMQRINAAGGRAVYCAANVRDPKALQTLFRDVEENYGPIRGLVHGAGVLADRRIKDKTDEQFDRVVGTKVDGLAALLGALPSSDALKLLALFSSSTARFGRVGQVDYAMANEAMNKMAAREAKRRPDCRVVSFNWGPWDGGMVDAALRDVFASEGVGVIHRAAGATLFADALAQKPISTEIVVLGPTPTTADDASRHPTSNGRSPHAANAPENATENATGTNGQSNGAAGSGRRALPVAFERRLDLETYPVLSSHVLDGHPVVPMAIIAEWLAHGAMHGSPGLAFLGFDRLRVLKGIVLDTTEQHRVRVCAAKPAADGAELSVEVEMWSGDETLHAAATVRLGPDRTPAPQDRLTGDDTAFDGPAARLYRDYLFHGPAMQSLVTVDQLGRDGFVARATTAPPPSEWIERPLRKRWLADPAVIDAVFQAMIVWTTEQLGAPSLPTLATRYRQYADRFPAGEVRLVGRIVDERRHTAIADVDIVAADGTLIARIEGYECAVSENLKRSFGKTDSRSPEASR